jgi:hypothetical protein
VTAHEHQEQRARVSAALLATHHPDVYPTRKKGPAPMTESEIERLVDRAVMRRLATDSAYLHAENAEEQAEREQEITDQELERITGSRD